jgi:hypothetical protein
LSTPGPAEARTYAALQTTGQQDIEDFRRRSGRRWLLNDQSCRLVHQKIKFYASLFAL